MVLVDVVTSPDVRAVYAWDLMGSIVVSLVGQRLTSQDNTKKALHYIP